MLDERPRNGPAAVPEVTFLFVGSDSPVAGDLDLTRGTSHGWRVTGDGWSSTGARSAAAAGVLEQRGDVLEVMQLAAGFEWTEFPSVGAAVGVMCRSGSSTSHRRVNTLRDLRSLVARLMADGLGR